MLLVLVALYVSNSSPSWSFIRTYNGFCEEIVLYLDKLSNLIKHCKLVTEEKVQN